MASYTIISNALSGDYVNKDTNELISFSGQTFHPGLIKYGISRFKVSFTNDKGDSVTQEHEIESIDPIIIDEQLKLTLKEFNERNGNYKAPDMIIGQPITL